jgi:hypothetical protein
VHGRCEDCIEILVPGSVLIAQFHHTRLDIVGMLKGGMSVALGAVSWCGGNRPLTFGNY